MKPQSSLSCLSASVFTRTSRAKEQSSNNRKLLFPLSPSIFLKPREKSPVGSNCWLSLVFLSADQVGTCFRRVDSEGKEEAEQEGGKQSLAWHGSP